MNLTSKLPKNLFPFFGKGMNFFLCLWFSFICTFWEIIKHSWGHNCFEKWRHHKSKVLWWLTHTSNMWFEEREENGTSLFSYLSHFIAKKNVHYMKKMIVRLLYIICLLYFRFINNLKYFCFRPQTTAIAHQWVTALAWIGHPETKLFRGSSKRRETQWWSMLVFLFISSKIYQRGNGQREAMCFVGGESITSTTSADNAFMCPAGRQSDDLAGQQQRSLCALY